MTKKIPKEISFYILKKQSIFLCLVISSLRGWGLVKAPLNPYLGDKSAIKSQSGLSKTYNAWFCKYALGFYRNYLHYLKIKGMGFKLVALKSNLKNNILFFKLGYSHRICFIFKTDLKFIYLNKQTFGLESRDLLEIKQVVYQTMSLRKPNAYKKKGIFLKGSVIKIKASSKKAKY